MTDADLDEWERLAVGYGDDTGQRPDEDMDTYAERVAEELSAAAPKLIAEVRRLRAERICSGCGREMTMRCRGVCENDE